MNNRKPFDYRTLCRVCLASGIKMHVVASPQLREVYEILTRNKLDSKDGIPTLLCYICYSQLRKCSDFQKVAQQSEIMLTRMYRSSVMFAEGVLTVIERPQVPVYSITPIENIDIKDLADGAEDMVQLSKNIKSETYESCEENNLVQELIEKDRQTDVKLDLESMTVVSTDFCDPTDFDSEDDVPLKVLKRAVKVAKKKRKYIRGNNLDVHVVTLTKEQQLQAVLSRADSQNFLNSPYRCTLCYKGFVDYTAFNNHMEKHDKGRGPHSCDVCKLRYRTARLLRSHTRSAHSHLYKCNKCGHHTHTKFQATDHQRWHEGHTYECQLCSQKFVRRTSYLTHVRCRHEARLACGACGARCLGAHGLAMHRAKAHASHQEAEATPAESRYCAPCDVQFLTQLAWARHMLTAGHGLTNSTCQICSAVVSPPARPHLRAHERALRPPRPAPAPAPPRVPCDQCGQTFVNKAKLNAHVKRIHLGLKYNKNIVCEICGKKCSSNASLRYHQYTHGGERPHACAACGKRFADTNQRAIHARTHSGERPYACQRCGRTFAQKPALNRHYRVHTGAKPYTCELCSKSFSQSNSLKVHVRSVHLKMPVYRKRAKSAAKSGNDVTESVTDVGKRDNGAGETVKMGQEELIK